MAHEPASLEIFPSILEQNPEDVIQFIKKNQALFSYVQIDIADGILVNGLTFSVADWVAYLSKNQSALPHTITSEFHLMVQDFIPAIQALATITSCMNIPTLLLHFEALQLHYGTEAPDFYVALRNECPTFEYGIVISDETQLTENLHLITAFPLVQIMTVEAGSQGRPFNEHALGHIKTLRKASYYGKIQLDGGINASTLPTILDQEYIPNAVCPGSFLKEHTEDHLKQLQKIRA